jgi:hypothetical protein
MSPTDAAWLELIGVVKLSMLDLSVRSYSRAGGISHFELELYDLDAARHFEVDGPELDPLPLLLLAKYIEGVTSDDADRKLAPTPERGSHDA